MRDFPCLRPREATNLSSHRHLLTRGRPTHRYAITSDDEQFHPAMFKPEVLLPGGSTTIQVIFLPRTVGAVDASLTLSTSAGDSVYAIQAHAVPNPYRLHPFTGAKVPLGLTYSHPIIMHNPTDTLLHVREVFTTEPFLTLQLPAASGFQSAADVAAAPTAAAAAAGGGVSSVGGGGVGEGMWQVAAHSEKEIIHLTFQGTEPGVFSGYAPLPPLCRRRSEYSSHSYSSPADEAHPPQKPGTSTSKPTARTWSSP